MHFNFTFRPPVLYFHPIILPFIIYLYSYTIFLISPFGPYLIPSAVFLSSSFINLLLLPYWDLSFIYPDHLPLHVLHQSVRWNVTHLLNDFYPIKTFFDIVFFYHFRIMDYSLHLVIMLVLINTTLALDQRILRDRPIHQQLFSYFQQHPHSETGGRQYVLEGPRFGLSKEIMKLPLKMKKAHLYGMDSARRQTRLAKFGSILVPDDRETSATKMFRYG